MTVVIVTVSDRAHKGVYDDVSGPEIEAILKEEFPDIYISRQIVPDERDLIRGALKKGTGVDFIITTGGTGISPRDITPDVTMEYCERRLPGIEEALRYESYRETPQAMLSRGAAGICGNTIIVNFPGSVRAVRLCTRVIAPIMAHAISMMRGEDHGSHHRKGTAQ